MSELEDLIGQSLDTISDEELEQAIITGRLAREYTAPVKEKKVKASKATTSLNINMDDFD